MESILKTDEINNQKKKIKRFCQLPYPEGNRYRYCDEDVDCNDCIKTYWENEKLSSDCY